MSKRTVKRWTHEELEFLIKNHEKLGIKECARILERTYTSVKLCINNKLKIIRNKPHKPWNEKEIDYLYKFYELGGAKECSKYINRTECSIVQYAKKLGLKNKILFTKEESDFIEKNYISEGPAYCANILNKDVTKVWAKATNLKIKDRKYHGNRLKQREIKSRMDKTDVELVSPFTECKKKHKFKCSCGNNFTAIAYSVLTGNTKSCGNCRLKRNGVYTSYIALNLHDQIISYGYPTTKKDHNYKTENGKYIDIALPKLKIGIEYEGSYWHYKTRKRDEERYQEIIKLGWKLLIIRSSVDLPSKTRIKNRITKLFKWLIYRNYNYVRLECKKVKMLGLDGRHHSIKLISKTRSNASSLHISARNILKELFPLYRIYEEVYIVSPPLYLDFFIPHIGVFEINGSQHEKYTPYFHNTKAKFFKGRRNDELKSDWCDINGLTLIKLNWNEKERWREIIDNRN